MSVIICLDPGHVRGYNQGCYKDYYEGTRMFKLAELLKVELEKYDFTVYLTRSLDENPSLYQRGEFAKKVNARCMLSLHTNASSSTATKSCVIYRSQTMPNAELLGEKLMDSIVEVVKAGGVDCTHWYA